MPRKKSALSLASQMLSSLDELLCMDATLQNEGRQGLLNEEHKERECLISAQSVLLLVQKRARKTQKEEFDAACKHSEEARVDKHDGPYKSHKKN